MRPITAAKPTPLFNSFTDNFRLLNGCSANDLVEWLFLPGMLFGEREMWWKPGGRRMSPHEGLDILTYRDGKDCLRRLSAPAKVPALLSGEVVGKCCDFLGETIILAHAIHNQASYRLHSFYAHLQPSNLQIGEKFSTVAGPIGHIAFPRDPPATCPPHLHLSLAWVDQSYRMKNFHWAGFCTEERFKPLDPLALGAS